MGPRLTRARNLSLAAGNTYTGVEAADADELELEVADRTHDLEAANAARNRMLIALDHDLRSPLAALTQRAELLRSGSPPPMADTVERVPGEFSGMWRERGARCCS